MQSNTASDHINKVPDAASIQSNGIARATASSPIPPSPPVSVSDVPPTTVAQVRENTPSGYIPSADHDTRVDRTGWGEKNWQVHIENVTGGTHRRCSHGKTADIVSSELLVEIKVARNLFDGIEQLDHYHNCFPGRDTILFLFGNDFPIRKIAKAGGWNPFIKELTTSRPWLNFRFAQPPIGLESMSIDWSTYSPAKLVSNRIDRIRSKIAKFNSAIDHLEQAKSLTLRAMEELRIEDFSDEMDKMARDMEELRAHEDEYNSVVQLTTMYIVDELEYGPQYVTNRFILETHYARWMDAKSKSLGIFCKSNKELLTKILIGEKGLKQVGSSPKKGDISLYAYQGVRIKQSEAPSGQVPSASKSVIQTTQSP